jgi:SAM-dependent methyltransferase
VVDKKQVNHKHLLKRPINKVQGAGLMRQTIKDFVSLVSTSLPVLEPIYEFGALQVPFQEGFADLRSLFPDRKYIGADMREGPGVDIILNLHSIALPSESVGTILCLDTLEHVEYPHKALEEIHRVLLPDGMAIISSVMDFPIHDHPYDYWRFTPEAIKSLFKPFASSFIGYAGAETFPHTVVGVGFKGTMPSMAEFLKRYEEWQMMQTKARRFTRMAQLVTPPIIYSSLASFYRTTSRLIKRPS